MKKMLIAVAVMGLAIGAMAAQAYVGRTTPTVISRTVYTNLVTFGENDYKSLEKYAVKNNTHALLHYTLAYEEAPGVWTTIGTNYVATTAAYSAYPTNAAGYGTTIPALLPVNKVRFIFTQDTTGAVSTIGSAIFAK